jgi:peptidoglycan hydrolase-like protein with peptidoglycan-binding domain
MTNIKKISAVGVSIATAMWLSGAAMLVPVAGAQTVADLQAQISALLAQIQTLQAQLAASQGGGASGCSFTRDLTEGVSGDDVKCLQNYLSSTGHFKFAGGATGFFGPITKSAVAAWQAANGVSPSSGFFGPISRAKYASLVSVTTGGTTTGGTTTGGTTTGGTTTGGTVTSGGVTVSTPGVEAIVTVEAAPVPANNVKIKEGETKDLMGVRVKSKQGDAIVERVKVIFLDSAGAATTKIHNKNLESLALYDGGTLLASLSLPGAVVKESDGKYSVTFSGFKVLVPKDGMKDLIIRGTARTTIDGADDGAYKLQIPVNGVRAKDGVGIDQYAPGTAFARDFTTEQADAENATLSISKAASSPKSMVFVGDSDGKIEGATVLVFDAKADKGRVKITDVTVTTSLESGTAVTLDTIYLYRGSTLISSAAVSSGSAAMTDLTDVFVEKDQTVTFTVKADLSNATSTATGTVSFSAGLASTNVTAENDLGDTVTDSGSMTGDTMYASGKHPVFTLVSKSNSYTPSSQSASGVLTGTFVVDVTARGGDIWVPKTGAFKINVASSTTGTGSSVGVSISYSQPANTTSGTDAYKIAKDQTARFTVSATVQSSSVTLGTYYNWRWAMAYSHIADVVVANAHLIDSYFDTTEWRTNEVFVN